jgi:hypothetical protein
VVDDALILFALASLPDGQEYLMLTSETRPGSRISRFGEIGAGHAGLRESLSAVRGARVTLGQCPDFNIADHEGLVSAAKGGIDGPR